MEDPQKISLYKVRHACDLNGQEAQDLLDALAPHGVFPYALWKAAYAGFWKEPAAILASRYALDNPPFPDPGQVPATPFPTERYARLMVAFFFEMARRIPVQALENGFDAVLESTYGSKACISEAQREYLFYHLRLVDRAGANGLKDIFVNLSAPDSLFTLFPDTMLLDAPAAVLHVSVVRQCPLVREVKGLTRRMVDAIVNAPPMPPLPSRSAPRLGTEPQDAIPVPTALWKGKTSEAIRAVMREAGFDNAVIAHVFFHKRGLKKQREVGRLLGPAHLSDSAYDKIGKELLGKAVRVNIIDME